MIKSISTLTVWENVLEKEDLLVSSCYLLKMENTRRSIL